jgi:hypothetical protein
VTTGIWRRWFRTVDLCWFSAFGSVCNLKQREFFAATFDSFEILPTWGKARMPIFEGKYEYLEAGDFDRTHLQLESVLQTSEYVQIAQSFVANTNRLLSFFEFPLQMMHWTSIMAISKAIGRSRLGIDPEDHSKDDDPAVSESAMAVYGEMTGKAADILELSSIAIGILVGDRDNVGISPAKEGVEAAFAAMIMSAYATFETLAVDLWICAVNRHVSLAQNWAKENKNKQLSMEDIYSRGGDLSKSSGTALHQTQKVTFESLRNIRTAYSHAFNGAINASFDDSPDLIKAEKTRHLFAHRGGLIDRKFKDEMDSFDDCKGMVIGERLRLTGPVTKKLIDACVSRGTGLLMNVNRWSQNHL